MKRIKTSERVKESNHLEPDEDDLELDEKLEPASREPVLKPFPRLTVEEVEGFSQSIEDEDRVRSYVFPLRLGMNLVLDLPANLTREEALRLSRFIQSLSYEVKETTLYDSVNDDELKSREA